MSQQGGYLVCIIRDVMQLAVAGYESWQVFRKFFDLFQFVLVKRPYCEGC